MSLTVRPIAREVRTTHLIAKHHHFVRLVHANHQPLLREHLAFPPDSLDRILLAIRAPRPKVAPFALLFGLPRSGYARGVGKHLEPRAVALDCAGCGARGKLRRARGRAHAQHCAAGCGRRGVGVGGGLAGAVRGRLDLDEERGRNVPRVRGARLERVVVRL